MKTKLLLMAITGLLLVTAEQKSFGLSREEKRTQGDAILKQMSEKLRSAQAITFSTKETIERTRGGEKKTINLQRDISVRQPNGFAFKATGDRDLECFYDGKNVTLVSHKDKVFGQFPAAPTLDETADIIANRYDIPLPMADLLTTDPEKALKDAKTTGGWEEKETVDGVECNKLSYKHPNVDFSIWIPVSGDPLPRKMEVEKKTGRSHPKTVVEFRDWNLSPSLSKETFVAVIPKGYEAVPVIQKASAVLPPENEAAGADKSKSAQPTDK